ncbi:MAG: cytochrome ubiquinol oxidase subunit I, partial [Marivirga sp.]|nr:cytochrome ubiquinol oxidase subunit I [Marivirga sp.]
WFTGVVVGISGLASGILVVSANAWMNSPAGFDYIDGQYLNIDPIKAMFNNAWFYQALHMTLAAFAATGFAVAGVHAAMIIQKKNVQFHLRAFKIAASFACVAAFLQPISGDFSAKDVAIRQPAKLAAMEAHFHTQKSAPLIIGGIPDIENKKVDYAIELPGMLSFLAHGNFTAEVKGLDAIPVENHPPVAVVHYAFQIMVGIGMLMVIVSVIFFLSFWKRNWLQTKWFFWLFVITVPLGFIAMEAGWTVTEVGRQPWIIHGIMRTADAVTPMPGIVWSFYLFSAVYISLSIVVVFLLHRQIKMVPKLYDMHAS